MKRADADYKQLLDEFEKEAARRHREKRWPQASLRLQIEKPERRSRHVVKQWQDNLAHSSFLTPSSSQRRSCDYKKLPNQMHES